jgi:glycine cleavage system H protein
MRMVGWWFWSLKIPLRWKTFCLQKEYAGILAEVVIEEKGERVSLNLPEEETGIIEESLETLPEEEIGYEEKER